MLGRTDSRGRALFFLAVLVLVAIALVARLAYWQVARRDDLAAMAAQQTSLRYEEAAERGSIYDRSGTVLLATTVLRDRLAAMPKLLTPERRAEVAEALIDLLQFDGAVADQLRERMATDREYVVLARDLSPQLSEEIRARSAGKDPELSGLVLEPEQVRVYPQEGGAPDVSLAAHLLGFVNREGQGQYGIEQYYQELLAGSPTAYLAQRDINGRPVPETATVLEAGNPGQDLMLTIDASLQAAVESELLAAWVADDAASASAVVMDPYTGQVYAYASYPAYDANDYRAIAATDPGRFVDPIVSTVYEPGSVFKMLTAAAALEQGTVTPTKEYKDQPTLKLDGGRTRIDNADHKSMGVITYEDAVAYSRNVIAAKSALELGATTDDASRVLYEMWQRLGFGAKTGIDLAGEVGGIARDPAITPWRQIDLANGSFGQGVAVTPIQLAQAYAAMVNGGTLVQPHVVQSIGFEDVPVTPKGTVLSPDLSATMRGLMRNVVSEVEFYRDRTLIPGYEVGGKTGTAQIWDPSLNDGAGGWKHNMFNYSFVGYVGRSTDRPDLVIAVRIEEGRPTVRGLGQLEMPLMSFQLFRRIAHDAITTPDLLAERVAGPAAPVVSVAPSLPSGGD